MDVRIGLTNSPRELEIELPDDADPDTVQASVSEAVTGGDGILWLTDRKGRRFGVVVEKLAFIDIGSGTDKGRIGFG